MTETKTKTPYRYPELNDLTCRLVRQGPKSWAVFVGDRDEPVSTWTRKREAVAYMERRSRSDASLRAEVEARNEGRFYPIALPERVATVAGMDVTMTEVRDIETGRRCWTVNLGSFELSPWAYVTESTLSNEYVVRRPGRPLLRSLGGGYTRERAAELLAEIYIQMRLRWKA